MSGQVTSLCITSTDTSPGPTWVSASPFPISGVAYLWLERGESAPITDIKIVHGANNPGGDWVRIPGTLNKNPDVEVSLWVLRDPQKSSIVNCRVLLNNQFAGLGGRIIDLPLNPGADGKGTHFLGYTTFKSKKDDEKKKTSWVVGDRLDVLDNTVWRAAQVLKSKRDSNSPSGVALYITYDGWPSKWDEWVPMIPQYCAHLGTRSKSSGNRHVEPPYDLAEHGDEFTEVANKVAELNHSTELTEMDIEWSIGPGCQFVRNVLNAEMESEWFTQTQTYLRNVVNLIIRQFNAGEELHINWLIALIRIFGGDSNCGRYYRYGTSNDDEFEGEFAVRTSQKQQQSSIYLLQNVEFFAQNKGFEALQNRIHTDIKLADAKSAGGFRKALYVFALLGTAKYHIKGKVFKTLIEDYPLTELVTRTIDTLSDAELKTTDKEEFTKFHNKAKDILAVIMKSKDVEKFMEFNKLQLSLRGITSDLLEKRLNGMTELERTIESIYLAENPHYKSHKEPEPQQNNRYYNPYRRQAPAPAKLEPAEYLTAPMLVEWLEEQKVVSIILGPGTHEQIIKRCPPILKFLAKQKRLDSNMINMLWSASEGKDEGTVRIVYECLGDLAQEMTEEQVDVLFARIAPPAKPIETFHDYDLNFVKLFTLNAVKATHKSQKNRGKWYGLDIFWQIIQDENHGKVQPDVAASAITMLKELLADTAFESERETYMNKCIAGLSGDSSTVQCMKVATAILSIDEKRLSKTLEKYEQDNKLIGLVMDRFPSYRNNAKVNYDNGAYVAPDTKNAKDSDIVLHGIYSHSENLSTRLEFLKFIVGHSKYFLVDLHINTLWDTFVTGRVMPSDTDVLVDWLVGAVKHNSDEKTFDVLHFPAVEHVFHSLARPPATIDISLHWFKAFQQYFIHINHQNGNLQNTSITWPVIENHTNMQQLQSLWGFALTTTNPEIQKAAQAFLVTIYLKLNLEMRSNEKKEILGSFVENAMKNVADYYQECVDAKDDAQEKPRYALTAALSSLGQFLTRIQADEMINRPLFQVGEKVTAYWGRKTTTKYKATVFQIHANGTYHLNYDDGDVDKQVLEANIFTSSEKKKTRPTAANDDTKYYPMSILSKNDDYFDLMFNVLGLGGEVGLRVWDLLTALPTNESLQTTINDLPTIAEEKKIDWNELFPSDSPERLLYTLDIVKNNVGLEASSSGVASPGAKRSDVSNEAKAWCKMFLEKGGLEHLFNILIQTSIENLFASTLSERSLELILRILIHFWVGLSGTPAAEAKQIINNNQMTPKLLDILAAVSEIKFETQPNNAKSVATGRLHASVATNSFRFLIVCVLNQKSLIEVCYQWPQWDAVLANGLIRSKNSFLRESMQQAIMRFVNKFDLENNLRRGSLDQYETPGDFFGPRLVTVLKHCDTSTGQQASGEYFSLLGFLVARQGSKVDASELAGKLPDMIANHPSLEEDEDTTDTMLVGLLDLAKALAHSSGQIRALLGPKLIPLVFEFLFEVVDPSALEALTLSGASVPPKCKSAPSRRKAFELLAELANGHQENCRSLIDMCVPNHYKTFSGGEHTNSDDFWSFQVPKKNDKNSNSRGKKSIGYAGLRNLGCICYMNSVMQQLFMLPDLRSNIFAIDSYQGKDSADVIARLQWLWAHLQEGEAAYANPKPFTDVWMDDGGKPIDVRVQEDSDGFIRKLIERVERNTEKTRFENVFKEVVGFKIAHQLIGTNGCVHFKERLEQAYTVSVDIKEKKTVEEGLQQFVTFETLEGDNGVRCDTCGGKQDTMKRSVLKTLPNTLVLHLKRFCLNYNTFQTEKIDSRLVFPMELDMKPYTAEALGVPENNLQSAYEFIANQDKSSDEKSDSKDSKDAKGHSGGDDDGKTDAAAVDPAADLKSGDTPPSGADKPRAVRKPGFLIHQDRDYYLYNLRGMVIHTGTATSGHYYSFIQERLVDAKDTSGEYHAGNWFQFNDHIVSAFDANDIPKEAFGGKKARANAYILFYDRQRKFSYYEEDEDGEKTGENKNQDGGAGESKTNAAEAAPTKLIRPRARVPPSIFGDIWTQNILEIVNKNIYDNSYYEFLWKLQEDWSNAFLRPDDDGLEQKGVDLKAQYDALLNSNVYEEPVDTRDALTRLCTRFFYKTVATGKNKQSVPQWTGALKRLYKNNVASCLWLLDMFANHDNAWLLMYAIVMPQDDSRNQCEDVRTATSDLMCYLISTIGPLQDSKGWDMDKPIRQENEKKQWVYVRDTRRGLVCALVDMLFDYEHHYLKAMHYRKWDNIWKTYNAVASLGVDAVAYLERNYGNQSIFNRIGIHNFDNGRYGTEEPAGFIARLIDIFMGSQSLASYANVALVQGGHRHTYDNATWTNFIKLLSTMVTTLEGPDAMCQMSNTMLTHPKFLLKLARQAYNYNLGQHVVRIINYLCTSNTTLFETIASLVINKLKDAEYEEVVRPYFRVLQGMLDIEDSLTPARVDVLMNSLTKILEENCIFWKVTDFFIDHIIRFAKKTKTVADWLRENESKTQFMIDWVKQWPRPPPYGDPDLDGHMKLQRDSKKNRNWHNYSTQSSPYVSYGLPAKSKEVQLCAILAGEEVDSKDASDSDRERQTRTYKVGDKLDVLDTEFTWLPAEVVAVSRRTIRVHFINYDKKWDFNCLMNDARLAPEGKYSKYNPPKKPQQRRGNR